MLGFRPKAMGGHGKAVNTREMMRSVWRVWIKNGGRRSSRNPASEKLRGLTLENCRRDGERTETFRR